MTRAAEVDAYFLPGVCFELNGEVVPARELSWAMFASCGCVSGMRVMTVDTVTLDDAWKQMSGNAQMIKRDKERGFDIRLVKHREIPFDDCPHSPKWGFMPPPVPPGDSWAANRTGRVLHLVPLTAAEDDSVIDWAEDDGSWSLKASSLCGKATEAVRVWSKKWYRLDGKVECSRCVKPAEAQALL
ncbi:hypothetical protein [Mycolicibacterium moriokaense]|jgi:hypothetical protein|nr:hypothetical protein [Mycolicibacterium moriokaense]MCV7039740.1 hypothetical protein [Mycolicibacterium moriokaense]